MDMARAPHTSSTCFICVWKYLWGAPSPISGRFRRKLDHGKENVFGHEDAREGSHCCSKPDVPRAVVRPAKPKALPRLDLHTLSSAAATHELPTPVEDSVKL